MGTSEEDKNHIAKIIERLKAQSRTQEYQELVRAREALQAEMRERSKASQAVHAERQKAQRKIDRNREQWLLQRRRKKDGYVPMRPLQGDQVTATWLKNYVQETVPGATLRTLPSALRRGAIGYGINGIRDRASEGRPIQQAKRLQYLINRARQYHEGRVTVWGTWHDANARPQDILPWRDDVDHPEPSTDE